MSFVTEHLSYEKTILSDLQGAWSLLRQSVVDNFEFSGSDKVLFHIDEAMSWECVRNLRQMPPLVLIIRNLCHQGEASNEILENIEEVTTLLDEVLETFPKG